WAHPVVIAPFSIASTPVTNAEFQAFVDDGGYRRRELWDRRGWDWRRREQAEHPVFWARGDDGRWYERSFDVLAALAPWHPVVHVNWYEAQPYFGQKKVLRGGCWTTRTRVIRSTWRNFYMRHRRNIFAGFRTVAL